MTKIDIEIRRTKEALAKTRSKHLRTDYTKHLNRLEKQKKKGC